MLIIAQKPIDAVKERVDAGALNKDGRNNLDENSTIYLFNRITSMHGTDFVTYSLMNDECL